LEQAKRPLSAKGFDVINLVVWLIGFVVYRLFMSIDTPVENTLPVLVITALICVVANKTIRGEKDAKNNA